MVGLHPTFRPRHTRNKARPGLVPGAVAASVNSNAVPAPAQTKALRVAGIKAGTGLATGGLSAAGILAFLMLALFTLTALHAAEVTATLSPPSVPAGEGSQLTIKILNGEVTALTAPEVPGLILNGPNQGRQVSIVNGVRTSAMSLTYVVGSLAAGE